MSLMCVGSLQDPGIRKGRILLAQDPSGRKGDVIIPSKIIIHLSDNKIKYI